MRRSRRTALGLAAAAFLVATGVAGANVAFTQVSADPYANATSQHATEVEPDTFADHGTGRRGVPGRPLLQRRRERHRRRPVRGRWRDLGCAGLPAMTRSTPALGEPVRARERRERRVRRRATASGSSRRSRCCRTRACRPCSSTGRPTTAGPGATPISIPPPASNSVDLDKNWTVCDNHPSSPFYGHCYTELDNFGDGDLELMSTSTDGGAHVERADPRRTATTRVSAASRSCSRAAAWSSRSRA